MNLFQRLIAALFPKKPDAKPVKFPESNFTYTSPSHMTEEQCGDLPCFRNDSHAISCWKFPLRDRVIFLLTGRMWLYLLMNGHPPVCLMTESPFPKAVKPPMSKTWKLVIAGGIVLGVLLALAGTNGLQDVCSCCVLGELDWTPAIHHQLIGRLARDGQKASVQVFIPVAPIGSDPTMASVLGLKSAQSSGIVDLGIDSNPDIIETDPLRVRQLAQNYLKSRGIVIMGVANE